MENSVAEAVKIIKSGGVILSPTDTICGLACDATQADAVKRISELKERAPQKSYIILVHQDGLINRFIKEVPDIAWDLFDECVKPTTLILDGAHQLAEGVSAQDGSVGVRRIKEGFLFEVLKRINKPLITTSANISGDQPPVFTQDVNENIRKKVDFIEEDLPQPNKLIQPSTLIRIKANGEFKILRD